MANCSKCNDPISPGETFCGKCGAPTPVGSAQPAAPASAAGQASAASPKMNKKLLGIILAVVAVVVVFIILWVTGIFGGSAAVSTYIKNTSPDFKTVSEDLANLDRALTYESSGDVDQDLEEMKTELAAIEKAQTDVATADSRLEAQRVTAPVQELDTNLRSFYSELTTDLQYRYEIVDYFYTAEKIGNKITTGAGDTNYEDIIDVQEGFRQLKYAIDEAVGELEDMEVPEVLQEVHDTDVELLKRMSTILGDMVQEIEILDDVGLTASLSQFDALLSEYDTKVVKQYDEILEPEFASLNETLEKHMGQKDVIEEEFAQLKGHYNIKASVFKLLIK